MSFINKSIVGLLLGLVAAVQLARADCITDPTTPSCSTFQLPLTLINPNITNDCDMMSQMPGCSLNTICSRTLPSFIGSSPYCDRFAILKTLCDDMDMGGCDGYLSMCRAGSVVAQCNATHLPLPGTDALATDVQSLCSHINASACQACKNANGQFSQQCDLLGVYADVCELAPAMPECQNWKTICALPGMSKWPLCGAQISCIDDPTQPFCSTFTLPAADVDSSIASLCSSMPNMPGCTLNNECANDTNVAKSEYCGKFAILKSLCLDMPRMKGCLNYTSLCSTGGSVVQQCSTPALALPSTSNTASLVKSICSEMYMAACEQCPGKNGPGTGSNCDLLSTYSNLCLEMPNMQQCGAWTSLCKTIPTWPWCDESSLRASGEPPMKMYFHVSSFDRILFESWITRTDLAFAGSWFICFLSAVLYEVLKLVRKRLEDKWEKRIEDLRDNGPAESEPLTGVVNDTDSLFAGKGWYSFPPFIATIDFPRASLQALEMAWSLMVMLIAMTFNVALFMSIPAGTFVGTLLIGRFLGYKAPTGCCS